MRMKPTRNRSLRLINLICLTVVICLFFGVALCNLFQWNRPSYSEGEKRELASFPAFSLQALVDGSFFRGLDSYISDTFWKREQLLGLSRKVKVQMGLDRFLDIPLFFPNNNAGNDVTQDSETARTIPTPPPTTTTDPTGTTVPVDLTKIISVTLSYETLKLETGGAATLLATLKTSDGASGVDYELTWTTSDPSVAAISVTSGRCMVTGVSEGSAVITASADNGVSGSCRVTVTKASQGGDTTGEVINGDYLLYNGAVYTVPYYGDVSSTSYANVISYWSQLFSEAKVSTLISPLASAMLDRSVWAKLPDQDAMIDKINAKLAEGINGINCYDELRAHREEYLFYKSDHHWTALGAYYAYRCFALSRGLKPTELSSFEKVLLNDNYHGSMYGYTNDERVKNIVDEVYAYLPTKEHTMTISYKNGTSRTYQSSIVQSMKSYLSFLAGDNVFVHINVPSNPQDQNIIVVKDSFGNAFIPYLTEHYGNIYVIDPRHTNFDVYERFAGQPITDILFMNNMYNANSQNWSKQMLALVKKS